MSCARKCHLLSLTGGYVTYFNSYMCVTYHVIPLTPLWQMSCARKCHLLSLTGGYVTYFNSYMCVTYHVIPLTPLWQMSCARKCHLLVTYWRLRNLLGQLQVSPTMLSL